MVNSRYRESSFFHDFTQEPFQPPLAVFNAGYSLWRRGNNYSLRHRKVTSINLITHGTAIFKQAGLEWKLSKGDAFISYAGQSQSFETGESGTLHKRFVLFQGILLDAFLASVGLSEISVVHVVNYSYLESLFRSCSRCLQNKEKQFVQQLPLLACAILLELGRCVHPTFPASLERAIAYVNRHLGENPSLAEIAHDSGLSPRQCTRLFLKHTGQSPIQFLLKQKMAWAESQLLGSRLSIKQISQNLGYQEPLYFSAQFKRFMGISPRSYRLKAAQG